MNTLNDTAIAALPDRYRANLMNGIAGYKPALLVGSASPEGQTNLAIFSSIFHVGANPALLGMIVRPNPSGTERHTLENILATGCYTLNHVTAAMTAAAHQTSARYSRQHSEFAATGLHSDWVHGFAAPFVVESPIRLGLSLAEHQPLAINGTHLIIGKIEWLHCPDELIREDGTVDLVGADSHVACGLDSYHPVAPGKRFAYAKPDQTPTPIT